MSGILTHGVQAESLVVKHGASEHKQDLLSTGKHIHIDTNSFSGSTHDLRAQTPTTRPRDDDENNRELKKRFSEDGFGNCFSGSANL